MCNRLALRCEKLNMDILSIVVDGKQVFFQWKMVMSFKRWPSNALYGCTKLTLGEDNRIITQRDYFDLWGTISEWNSLATKILLEVHAQIFWVEA